jgi:hypothetical protein
LLIGIADVVRWLIMKPTARRDQHEYQNGNYGQVVLPGAALVRPEENP